MTTITQKQTDWLIGQLMDAAKERADEPVLGESSDGSVCVVDQANGNCYRVEIKLRKF